MKRWLKRGGLVLGALLGVLGAAILILQVDAVGGRVVEAALLRAPLVTDAEVRAVRGSWLGGLDLDGVRLVSSDRGQVELASVRARWSLLPLLRRAVRVRLLELVDPNVEWDACTPLPESSDTTSSGWTVRLDSIALVSAEASGQACLQDGARSSFGAESLSLGARGIALGDRLSVDALSISGSLRPPETDSAYRADVTLRGAFSDGSLVIDTLSIGSPRSAVRGSGSITLQSADTDSSRLTVVLAPLAARDLQPWAGDWLVDDAVARGQLSVTRSASGTSIVGSIAIDGAGSADIDANWSDDADRVSYGGALEARAFDPSRLFAQAPEALIDGRAEGALEGPSLAASNGRIVVDVTDSRVADEARSASVEIDVREGVGDVAAEVSWAELRARIDGTARPFAETPTYDLTTDVNAFAVGPDTVGPLRIDAQLGDSLATGTIRGPVARGRADGAFRVELGEQPRFVLERLVLDDVAPASLDGRFAIDRLDVEGTVDAAGLLRATAIATTTVGRVEAGVAGDLRDPDGAITIEDGVLTQIDLGALVEDGVWTTALAGTFGGTVRRAGGAADSEAIVRLALEPSTIGTQEVDEGEMALDLRDGVVRVDGRLAFPEGALSLRGRARPFDSTPSATVDSLVLRTVDLASLAASDALPTLLDGRLSAEGQGAWPSVDGTLDLRVAQARVGAAHFTATTVSARASDGAVDFEARLAGPWGEGAGRGWARMDETSTALSAEGDFDIQRLSGLLGEGVRPGQVRGLFDIEVVDPGTDGSFSTASLTGGGRVRLLEGAVADVPFDSARVVARMSDGVVRLDSTSVWSSVGTVDVAGTLPFADGSSAPAELTLQARAGDLSPVASWLEVERVWADSAGLEATVTGVRDSLAVRASARAHFLSVGSVSAQRTTGSFDGVIGPEGALSTWNADLRVRSAEGGGVLFDSTDVSAEWDGAEYHLDVESLVDRRRHVRLGGRFDPTGRGGTLEELEASVDEDRWRLQWPATVTLGAAPRVEELVLVAGRQRIEVRGGIDPAGTQDLSVLVQSFRVESVADLRGWGTIGGTVDASLDLSGSASDPTANLRVVADLTEEGSGLGVFRLDASGEASVLTMEGDFVRPDGVRAATLSGTVPFAMTLPDSLKGGAVGVPDGPIDLTLHSDAFALEWVAPFVESASVEAPRGMLIADVRALGTTESPELSGRLSVADAGVRLPDVGIDLTNGRLAAVLTADRIRIDTLRVRSRDGTASATGSVTLANLLEPELSLDARLDGFEAVRNDLAEATLSGDLTIAGTPFAPEVAGTLDVLRAEVNLDAELATPDVARVELTEDDIRMLEATFGFVVGEEAPRTGLYEASDLRLQLAVGRDTWVRQRSNPEMALQFSGDLNVDKRPEETPEVTGTLNAISGRSYISQFGRRFDVASGEVDFPGPLTEARVDVTAIYTVPSVDNAGAAGVTITLAAAGTADALSLELSSEPAMDNADIVSYIATGRPASQGFSGAGSQSTLLGAGAAVASDQLLGLLQRTAMDVTGVEVLQIDSDGIVAGWFLSPRLYVGFTQPLFSGSSEVRSTEEQTRAFEIEYEAYRWLVLNLQRGGSRIGFFLKSRYAY